MIDLATRRSARSIQTSATCYSGLSINWGIPLATRGPVTPVTLLSGFLGAGKTTLLKNVLENRAGLRVGVIVNDVAAVNVDGKLIKSEVVGVEGVEVTELQNGCVCCSLADDLLSAVADILTRATGRVPFDHVIVELSGVSEPQSVRNNWHMARELGHPAALRSEIARVATLVDASAFKADWLDGRVSTSRNEDFDTPTSSRSVVELLAEQIETADIILVNKIDLVDASELESVEAIVHSMNAKAALLRSAFGKVDPAALFQSGKSSQQHIWSKNVDPSHSRIHGGASCNMDHGHEHGHSHGHDHGHGHAHAHDQSPQVKYGIHSFVYKQRRPFHDRRFRKFSLRLQDQHPLRDEPCGGLIVDSKVLTGLLRAKGVCWLDREPLLQHAWSFAGRIVALERDEPWWHACGKQQIQMRLAYPGMQAVYDKMLLDVWDASGEWGDRRQELVFIGGQEMDEASIRGMLDICLLTDEEMDVFRNKNLGKTLDACTSLWK